MGKDKLFVAIEFNMNGKYKITGDVKKEKRIDIISEFVRGQAGKRKDKRKANKKDIYHIKIEWNPDMDVFTCTDDTGNFGLRDGILLTILSKEK